MASDAKPSPILAVQKLMGAGISAILRRGFNSSKCKTEAKMATARMKLLKNKREALVRQMRRDIAQLLESGRDETARIRVEHVIREQNVMAANEIIELFCDLIVARLPIIAKQRDCPLDLKEGISSLIYASPRCSEIPELSRIACIFEKKYGKEFVSAAIDLRSESGVNRMLIEKLSVRKPSGQVKLKFLKEIAKEYQVKWDPAESERELLKPPEELIEGPCSFSNATSFPVKQTLPMQPNESYLRPNNNGEDSILQFKDPASAAQAAAESAEKALHAAQVAALLANQNSYAFDQNSYAFDQSSWSQHDISVSGSKKFVQQELRRQSLGSVQQQPFGSNTPSSYVAKPPGKFSNSQSLNVSNHKDDDYMHELQRQSLGSVQQRYGANAPPNYEKKLNSQSFNMPNNMDEDDMDAADLDEKKILRRNSCISPTVRSDIHFDDSDGLESEPEAESPALGNRRLPPSRPPPALPSLRRDSTESSGDNSQESLKTANSGAHVHPKLPDYEALAARFESLKSRGM